MKINIFGAGTWGITVANYLANKGCDVYLYSRNSSSPNFNLGKLSYKPKSINRSITFNTDIESFNLDYLNIIAVPSNAVRDIMSEIYNSGSKYLLLSKGFDIQTGYLPVEILFKEFNISVNNISVLSGPNHAEEIILNKITASVIASRCEDFSKDLQKLFSSESLRIYTSTDVIGVQIGGAIKNVIAIASGIASGLHLGDNALSALVSRGMNEISLLSHVYNMKKETLFGLSGLGDLIATCFSKHSRNKQLGELIATGKPVSESLKQIGMVSEGYYTAKNLYKVISENNLDMPICIEVYNILYNNASPSESLKKLMTRRLINEIY